MPVAEKFIETCPWSIEKRILKHPTLEDEQHIPTIEQEQDIAKFISYNGLWLILTYGAGLLSLVAPWLGTGFKWMIKFRFKNKWEQK